MDPKEARRAMIAAAREKRLQEGTNMFKQEVTVREPPLGLPNLGYLKNSPNVPKPEFLNSTVSLNRQRPEWSGKAYTTHLAQRLITPYYGPRVPSVPNTVNQQQIGPQYNRLAFATPNLISQYRARISQYRNPIKGTTGFTEPTKLTLNNASSAVNRAMLVEKEVSTFPEGVVRAPEVPAPGTSGCFGGFCLPWGGNMKKTRNRRRTKKNTRRRSTRRRR